MSPPLRQPELFAVPTPPPVPGLYAEVAVPLPIRGTFSYAVPAGMSALAVPGARVAVPFGGQRVVGYVLSRSTSGPAGVDPGRIRALFAVLDAEPVFPEELLKLLREAADYYLHPLGEVLRTAAPAVDKRARKDLPVEHGTKKSSLKARWARVREETFVKLTIAAMESPPALRGGRQSQLVAILEERGEVSMTELRRQVKEARTVIAALAAKDIVAIERREIPADPFFGEPMPRDVPPPLTDAQAVAAQTIVSALARNERATFLLHGVTGSGKTEVYLRAVEAMQQAGKGALILLPEIALTPQLVARYRARFGDNLAVVHSGLKDDDRHAMWRKLHAGECRVAIGARSAIFAPVHNLGLIIVDEEHDGSFKQEDTFRYHGRDLALLRAHRAGIVCVLGSATPSVESYQAALDGRFGLLTLPERATAAPLPGVELVDLRRMGRRGPTGHEMLSLPLVRALEETLTRGEQAIIFLNRRGFAPSVRCGPCGVAISCSSCSVALVLHRREQSLKCHYCDFTAPYDNACIKCGSSEVVLLGVGTEKLEQSLVSSFPKARIGRLDRDVASGMGAENVLSRLRRGELDVLVGTQMVTKGHDFARVTLVGVIAADTALAFPDFRACERTFQLLAQVAGRAGRKDLPGRVIIQTYQPEHPVLRRARSHDFLGFFADEIAARRELGYPPFGRLAAVRFDSLEEPRVHAVAAEIGEMLRGIAEVANGQVKVLGPAPSPLERLRSRYRMQLLVRAAERPRLRQVLLRLAEYLDTHAFSDVRVAIDVDPVQML